MRTKEEIEKLNECSTKGHPYRKETIRGNHGHYVDRCSDCGYVFDIW